MSQKFDPITLEILWRRLISIVDEADASVYRTSFSSLIRDAHDYTNAFFDQKGREICQGTMVTPGQLGALALGIKKICRMFPEEDYKPGDVFISNDPWLLAGHLNDICVISPIFFKDKLVAFAAFGSNQKGLLTPIWPRELSQPRSLEFTADVSDRSSTTRSCYLNFPQQI